MPRRSGAIAPSQNFLDVLTLNSSPAVITSKPVTVSIDSTTPSILQQIVTKPYSPTRPIINKPVKPPYRLGRPSQSPTIANGDSFKFDFEKLIMPVGGIFSGLCILSEFRLNSYDYERPAITLIAGVTPILFGVGDAAMHFSSETPVSRTATQWLSTNVGISSGEQDFVGAVAYALYGLVGARTTLGRLGAALMVLGEGYSAAEPLLNKPK